MQFYNNYNDLIIFYFLIFYYKIIKEILLLIIRKYFIFFTTFIDSNKIISEKLLINFILIYKNFKPSVTNNFYKIVTDYENCLKLSYSL